jgi:pimeloyl-ACP methyl ester carboxylesterase
VSEVRLAEAGTRAETPLFFPAGEETLFGVLTTPPGRANGLAALTLPGAWYGTSTGRNRLLVRMCRRLAGAGFHALRFDYRGVGESTGSIEAFRLEEPLVEDLDGAVRALEARGLTGLVLVGVCFGGRTALLGSPRVADLRAVVLVSPPLGRGAKGRGPAGESSIWTLLRRALRVNVLKGLFDPHVRRLYARVARKQWRRLRRKLRPQRTGPDPREDPRWATPEVLRPLEALVARRVPVLMAFGEDDIGYADFLRAGKGRFGELLERAGSLVQVEVLKGPLRGFARVEMQDLLIDRVVGWLQRLSEPEARAPGPGLGGDPDPAPGVSAGS